MRNKTVLDYFDCNQPFPSRFCHSLVKGLPRLNDTDRIRPFSVTLRLISGLYTAVISGAEIRSVHSEDTAHIRPYTLKIRHRISAPDITGKYGPFTVPYEANYGENTDNQIDRPG